MQQESQLATSESIDNFTETAPIKSLTPDLVKEDLAKACFPNYPEIGVGLIGKGYAQ